MKIFFILFIMSSALFTGCSTSYNYQSSKITIHKIYEDEKDYSLLSVRGDSAIVVLDWSEHDVKPIPFSHAQVMRNDSIAWIGREGKGGFNSPSSEAILLGAGFGALTTGVLLPNRIFDSIFGSDDIVRGLKIIIGIGIGAVVGALISIASPSDLEITLGSQKSWEILHSISAYPDKEPPEMQYIK